MSKGPPWLQPPSASWGPKPMASSALRILQNTVQVRWACGKPRGFRACTGQPSKPLLVQPAGVCPLRLPWSLYAVAPRLPSCLGFPERAGRPLPPPSFAHKFTFPEATRNPAQARTCQVPAQPDHPTAVWNPGVLVAWARPQLQGVTSALTTDLRGDCDVHTWPLTSSPRAASPSGPTLSPSLPQTRAALM